MITDLGEENARLHSFTESALREYERLGAEVNLLHVEVDRAAALAESTRREREVANRFPSPTRPSPFAREPRPPRG